MTNAQYPLHLRGHQSVTLATLAIAAVALFLITAFVTRLYHAREQAQARQWFAEGQAALATARPDRAVTCFRNALMYSADPQIRLELAQALIAAGRNEEASAYLKVLWEHQPGDAVVNQQLARLAAAGGQLPEAREYYHNAIYGVWQNADPVAARRRVRLELIDLLLQRNETRAADAELLALLPNLPNDAADYTRVASLFVRAGDSASALAAYRKALELGPRFVPALVGAGELEFQAGDFGAAERYLERAMRLQTDNARAAQLLEIASLVMRSDPFAARLTADRANRGARAFAAALSRLRSCARQSNVPLDHPPPTSELDSLYAEAQQLQPVNEKTLRSDPDALYPVMDWVTKAEDAATRVCGPPSGMDQALSLIGRNQRHTP